MKRLLAITSLAFLLAACSDPKDIVFNDMDDLKTHTEALQKLTTEEKDLLAKYTIRKELGKAFGQGNGIEANTKVGDAIEEQRKLELEKAEQEKAEKLAQEKAQAEAQAKIDAINNAVSVYLVSKEMQPRGQYQFSDTMTLSFKITNKSDKVITGIKGTALFYDKFDDQIDNIGLKIDFKDQNGKLAAGADYEYVGSLDVHSFEAEKVRLSTMPLSDVKFKYIPETVLFEDGSNVSVN